MAAEGGGIGTPSQPLSWDLVSQLSSPTEAHEPRHEDLTSVVQNAVRVEIARLQTTLHVEFQELRAAMGKARDGRRLARAHSGFSAEGTPAAPTPDLPPSHAWVNRSMRSYALAEEWAVGSDSDRPERAELLPGIIPKGTGPLSVAFRRGNSMSSTTGSPTRVRPVFDRQDSAPAMAWGKNNTSRSQASANSSAGGRRPWFEAGANKSTTSAGSQHVGMLAAMSYASHTSHAAGPMSSTTSAPGKSDHSMHPAHDAMVLEDAPEQIPLPSGPDAPSMVGNGFRAREFAILPTIRSMTMARTNTMSPRRTCVPAKALLSPQQLASNIVRSPLFEQLALVFIVFNTVMVGVQADYCARSLVERSPYSSVDLVIAGFFFLELALRLFAFRRSFFTRPGWRWNVCDLTVVSLQVLEEIALYSSVSSNNVPIALSLMRLLRILRLIRIIRAVRLLQYMNDLRTIVLSVTSSLKPLLSTIVLLALVVYVVAIYFTQIALTHRIDHKGSQGAQDLETYFGSLGAAVMSLFQTVTGGLEWRNMTTPLMKHISPIMGLVFALYVVFTSLALMNIVTGVFVETALQRGREDKEVYMINHLRDLFGVLDENKNGMISWCELEEHLDDPKLKAFFRDIDIDLSEAQGLFLLLDRNGSGTIDADEFLTGCLRLRGPAKSLDMQLVMRELADQRTAMHRLLLALHEDADEDQSPIQVVNASRKYSM